TIAHSTSINETQPEAVLSLTASATTQPPDEKGPHTDSLLVSSTSNSATENTGIGDIAGNASSEVSDQTLAVPKKESTSAADCDALILGNAVHEAFGLSLRPDWS